jgi:hypothetical protein
VIGPFQTLSLLGTRSTFGQGTARERGYGLSIIRSKTRKGGTKQIYKAYLICDRGGQEVYQTLELPPPMTFVTDADSALIAAIFGSLYPNASHLLYISIHAKRVLRADALNMRLQGRDM